jgi:hypothetical protein
MNTKLITRDIEERYETDDREISQERNDFLLPQIIDFVERKQWINLQPEYQRRQVWDKKKQSRFIESMIMNLPVPPIFLFEADYNRYEVMDGQQRLSAVLAFYQNKLKLSGLEHWKELHGKGFSELPPKLQRGLDRRRISAVVLHTPPTSLKSAELRRIVFERLNTGGQRLNNQELRNCLYSSPFASLLVELAGNSTFNDLCDIPRYEINFRKGSISAALAENTLFKRMTDCEMVLRFFAFRDTRAIKGSVKTILDNCMKTHSTLTDPQLGQMRELFSSRVEFAAELLGTDAFKVPSNDEKTIDLSIPYYDAVMVACDRMIESKEELILRKEVLRKKLRTEQKKPDMRELLLAKKNTAVEVKNRLDFVEEVFRKTLG